jgi:hypothetical protein
VATTIVDPFAETDKPAAKAKTVKPAVSTESREQIKIRELEAKLAQLEELTKQPAELTEAQKQDQKRIRELEDQLARQNAKALDDAPEKLVTANPGSDTILLHILEDGFTACGRVWYRGQEIEFEIGGPAYNDTKDRNGWTWLSLIDDEYGQALRWGTVMFRRGAWPGAAYSDDTALLAERKRNRAAPELPRV